MQVGGREKTVSSTFHSLPYQNFIQNENNVTLGLTCSACSLPRQTDRGVTRQVS